MKRNRANFRGATQAPPTLEEQKEFLDNIYDELMDRIEDAIEDEEITEEDAEALEDQANADYDERLEALEAAYEAGEIESEEDEDDADYAYGTDLATFAAAAEVEEDSTASIILALAEETGYEDVESLIVDLSNAVGITDRQVVELLSGEAVPDAELAEAIAEAFGLDDEGTESFVNLAEVEADEGEDDEEDEDEEGADYSRHNDRLAELEAQVAEFQTTGAISNRLIEIERTARLGVEQGWLPPIARDAILGNFEMHEDRVASFSQVCDANQVTPDVELYAIEKQLAVFEQMGPIWARFGAIAQEPITERESNNQDSLRAQARRNAAARRNRNGGAKTAQLTKSEDDN